MKVLECPNQSPDLNLTGMLQHERAVQPPLDSDFSLFVLQLINKAGDVPTRSCYVAKE